MIGGIIFFLILGFGFVFIIIAIFTVKENRPSDKSESVILSFKRFKMLYELEPDDWELWIYPRYKMKRDVKRITEARQELLWTHTSVVDIYFNNPFDVLRYKRFHDCVEREKEELQQTSLQSEFIKAINKSLQNEKDIARENMEKAIAAYEKIREVLADE